MGRVFAGSKRGSLLAACKAVSKTQQLQDKA